MEMEQIIEYLKGIIESIKVSGARIENKTLSQKDRQNMNTMLAEIIDNISKNEILMNNKNMAQISEHLASLQDAFLDMNAEEIEHGITAINEILPELEYELSFNRLTAGIFQTDSQIMKLQDEKADMLQQLMELDMQKNGQLTDLTTQILEVNHFLEGEDEKIMSEKELMNEETKQAAAHGQHANESEAYTGVVYMSQSSKRIIEGKSPEDIINTIKELQEDRNNPISKAKTVYIQRKGTEAKSASSKYDIASGKNITPIYLKIPHSKPDEFKKITAYLKENGAVYNPHKTAWYVTKENDLSKFKDFIPEEMKAALRDADAEKIKNMEKREEQPPKTAMLYGEKVTIDYYVSSNGLKEVTQRDFDKIINLVNGLKQGNEGNEQDTNLDFSNCWFQEVEFKGEVLKDLLRDANFSNARFSDCKFVNTQLVGINFNNATMQSCDIEKSEFLNCDFKECHVSQTRDKQSVFVDCNFEKAYFKKSSYNKSVMDSPNFNMATMNGTEFINPVVRKASTVNTTFTMGGATHEEVKNYEKRTVEALSWYDRSITSKLKDYKQVSMEQNENSGIMKEHELTGRKER